MQGKWMITCSSVLRQKDRRYLHFIPKAKDGDKILDNMKLSICGIRPDSGWLEKKKELRYCKHCQILLNKSC